MQNTIFGTELYFKSAPHNVISELTSKAGISHVLANLLALRGLENFEEIDNFLNPTLKALMPNPLTCLLDMPKAVHRTIEAIKMGHKIAIFADYDVDGACCGAMLKRYFEMLGIDALIYIPDRFAEGYGPNTPALLGLAKQGYKLVFTVDCGTVAFDPLEQAAKAGLDVIVVDHHLGVKQKPDSIAIINPNRFDETSDLTYLCGAGVVFMLLAALNKTLREGGFFEEKNQRHEPNLIELCSLAALATICDVVPLVGFNRAIVVTGLRQINKNQTNTKNIGLKMLCNICGIKGQITERDLGFALGPRINAGGRLANACLGAELLSTSDSAKAFEIANKLNELNIQRRTIEEQVRLEVQEQIEAKNLQEGEIIFCGGEDYHQGVIGITASRIKEKYNKPVCIMEYKEGVAKASCRSVGGIDIGVIINAANNAGLLIKGGGHAMAGGYSCHLDKLTHFETFAKNYIKTQYPNFVPTKIAEIDAKVSLSIINNDFYETVAQMGPFGSGNGEPIFYTTNLTVLDVKKMAEVHLAIIFKCQFSGKTIRSCIFNFERLLPYETFFALKQKPVELVFKIKQNTFYSTPQIEAEIVDIICN